MLNVKDGSRGDSNQRRKAPASIPGNRGGSQAKGDKGKDMRESSGPKDSKENDHSEATLNAAEKAENEKKVEEENRKTEEEQKIKEEIETKKREEEEAAHAAELETQEALDLELQAQGRTEAKKRLRDANLQAYTISRDPSIIKNLDSNLQKTTRFKNKIKVLSDANRASIVIEFQGVNLSKFVEEVVEIIVSEAKIKDMSVAVELCSLMHQRYEAFAESIATAVMGRFPTLGPAMKQMMKDNEATAIQKRVSIYRTAIRLWGELIIFGVLKNADDLLAVLQEFCLLDKDHQYLNVITTFCRYCNEDLLGILPRKQRMLLDKYKLEVPRLKVLPENQMTQFREIIHKYYNTLAQHLVREHNHLEDIKEHNLHIMHTKGELHQDRKERFEESLRGFEKLSTGTSTLADLLDRDLPDLPVRESKDEKVGISLGNRFGDGDGVGGIWEDDDMRSFYENLVELRAFVPAVLFGSTDTSDSKEEEKSDDVTEDVQYDNDGNILIKDIDESDKKHDEIEAAAGGPGASAVDRAAFDLILTRLANAANRELVDGLATEFCYVNNKRARTRLVNALFAVPRNRLDLIPCYSRLVATLGQCIPEIGARLLEKLEAEFYGQVKHSGTVHIEARLRNVRYISELTKFGVCPPNTALNYLQKLVTDFSSQSIMVACAMLESCGRFLYRTPDSHIRTRNVLEILLRKKTAIHLDARLITAIENAFYYCNPPERSEKQRKIRPPMHLYIQSLLYKQLSKTTIEKVLRQMKRLAWNDPEIKAYTIKCLSKPWKCKYNNIYCLASLVAGIDHYYSDVGVKVVDNMLENIRLSMEVNALEWNQRRIGVIKYIGELYNYRLFESALLFEILYSIIFFSHDLSAEGPSYSSLDALDDYFRIRWVCTLLESCGQYFDEGSLKRKMDCFLVYFQRYILGKKQPLPLDIEFMVQDTFEMIRPGLALFNNYSEANQAIIKMQQDLQASMTIDQQGGTAADTAQLSDESGQTDDDEDVSEEVESEGEDDERREGVTWCDSEGNEYLDDTGERLEGDEVIDFDDVHLKATRKHEETAEDAAFLEEFNKFVGDQILGRKNEKISTTTFDAAIPMYLKTKESTRDATGLDEVKPENAVMFTVMTKKGNKPQLREVAVPLDSSLAINVRQKKEEEAAEHRELKRLVLEYEERDVGDGNSSALANMNASSPAPRVWVSQSRSNTASHQRMGPPPVRTNQHQRRAQGSRAPLDLQMGATSYEEERKPTWPEESEQQRSQRW